MTQTTPAALMAIVHAAHVAGDRDLERGARRELRESFGIDVTYRCTPKASGGNPAPGREPAGAAR